MKLESRMNKIVPCLLCCKLESSKGPIYKRGNEHQKWDNEKEKLKQHKLTWAHQKWDNLYTKRCTTPSTDDNALGVSRYKVRATGYHSGMTK